MPYPAADDFHAKTRMTLCIMRVTPEICLFCPISEEIARLLICVLSHDDVIASGAWHIAGNFKKRQILLRSCSWLTLTDNYCYTKLDTFLVILTPHLSPVVVFGWEKTVANFRSGDSLAHPSLFIIVRRAPRPSDRGHRGRARVYCLVHIQVLCLWLSMTMTTRIFMAVQPFLYF